MSDDTNHERHASGDEGHDAAHIHMPPNSIVPVFVALSLCCTFVGFVDQVRNNLGPTIWLIGLVSLIASCVAWFRGARTEYLDLPETLDE